MENLNTSSIQVLYELGFGTVDANALIGYQPNGLLATVLLANLPQGILSFLYLTYNGIFSCVVSADEWSQFAHSRRPLRVTAPAGKQRSTYYLQLPYTYAIPLLIISGTLHWLMSQSLFLALATAYDDTGAPVESISQVGYSCIAIFCSLIVGGFAIIVGIANGFRRYKAGIPLAGSCSAAISAACHRPPEDVFASFKPVKWGVVEGDKGEDIGHCCFTSFEVTEPVETHQYAGWTGSKAKSS